jgi:hypothetical protein
MIHLEQFVLSKVIELDLDFGDKVFPVRLEFFRSDKSERRYRCRVWRSETYTIEPKFGAPSADEELLINWEHLLATDYRGYDADSLDSAVRVVLDDLQQSFSRATSSG